MSRILHIVNKSPADGDGLDRCLRMALPGDGVLLIEDAVLAALANGPFAPRVAERTGDLELFALVPDVAARGLADQALFEAVERVDYAGFVDLVTAYDVTQSWF